MLRSEIEKYQHLILKAVVLLFAVLLGYIIFRFLLYYFMPFITALILSLILEPIVKFFQRLRIGRGYSVLLSMILFLGSFITLATFAVTRIVFELTKLYNSLPDYSNELYQTLNDFAQRTKDLYLQLPPEATNIAQEAIKAIFDKLAAVLSHTTTSLIDTVTSLPGILIFLIITLIATFFLTKDKAMIKDFVFRQLPPTWEMKLASLKDDLFSALIGFLKAQAILLSVTFTESYIGLSIIGVDYAFIIALLIALVDILPVLGTGSVYVPWALFNIAYHNYRLGIYLLILYGIIITVRYMIEPKVVGTQLGIHPVVALMSMFVGLKLLGVVGVILGPTTVVVIKACQHAGIIPKFK